MKIADETAMERMTCPVARTIDGCFSFFENFHRPNVQLGASSTDMPAALYQPFPMLPGHRAQVWRHQPAYRRPRHFHAEPELNIVLGGWARMGVGRHEVTIQTGDLLLLKPAQDHVLLDCSDDVDLFVAAATPELVARFSLGEFPTRTMKVSLPPDRLANIREKLRFLHDARDAAPYESAVGGLFQWTLPRSPGGHVVSRQALRSIYDAADESAGVVARRARVDAAELSRNFSSDFGVKFVEARARMRLIRFIDSVDGGHSMTRAAAQHFGSYAQCHRVFRRYLECTPREYFAGQREFIAEATFHQFDAGPRGDRCPLRKSGSGKSTGCDSIT